MTDSIQIHRKNASFILAVSAVSYTHLDVYKRQADRYGKAGDTCGGKLTDFCILSYITCYDEVAVSYTHLSSSSDNGLTNQCNKMPPNGFALKQIGISTQTGTQLTKEMCIRDSHTGIQSSH